MKIISLQFLNLIIPPPSLRILPLADLLLFISPIFKSYYLPLAEKIKI